MKNILLKRRDWKDIDRWCFKRNHGNIKVPSVVRDQIKAALKGFPGGQDTRVMLAWWQEKIPGTFSDVEWESIKRCIYTNTAMEDSQLPKWILSL